jgi:cardiolipin synthase
MRRYFEAEEIKLVFSGQDYFARVEEIIDASRETLHFQTYIFESDNTGMTVVAALKRAAMRGVKVWLMVDAYGSFPFSGDTEKELAEAGVKFRLYSPLLSAENRFFGRRMHHKILVADKNVGLIGGINVADKYRGDKEAAWLDYGVRIRGEVCEYLHLLCQQFYEKRKLAVLRAWENKAVTDHHSTKAGFIRFRRNDWILKRNEIYRSYIQALHTAEKEVIIVASYFLPGRHFRNLLKKAASRGVQISIVLSGRSDVTSASFAEHYLFDFYLYSRIRIFEWHNSVMHGKAMLVDGTWATIGSFNLNFLSHYVSIELNADIIGGTMLDEFGKHLNDIIRNDCVQIDLEHGRKQSTFTRVMMFLAYNFYRILKTIAMLGRRYRKVPYRRGSDKRRM